METMPKFEGETTTYNREAVAEAAMEQADTMLEEKIHGLQEMSAAEKIESIKGLIAELSVTAEGTDIPVHNEHRHVVEALAARLVFEELAAELKKVEAKHPALAYQETA
jgi:hypothetical protein